MHWVSVFNKTIASGGTVYYHDCCISFSRRGFKKKSGHPAEMSVSIQRLPELKKCRDHEDFYLWINEKIKMRPSLGLPAFFPTINCCHSNFKPNNQTDEFKSPSFLVKRYKEMEEEVEYRSSRSTT